MEFGNYEVLRKDDGTLWELGRGGFGTTYKARHKLLMRECALKVINDSKVASDEAKNRFRQEAQAAASLSHPHIASVFDFGETDGTYYYAMEFCAGGDLDQYAAEHGSLPWTEVEPLLHQMAMALRAAHKHGLLHRDFKPSNVMLVGRDIQPPHLKLIDFGLVKIVEGGDGSSTQLVLSREGSAGFNPLTASPEQLREEELDARTDLFSLGVTVLYLLCGGSPFGNTAGPVIMAHRLDDTSYDHLIPEEVPYKGKTILSRLLKKNRDDRYTSTQELLDDLESTIEEPASSPIEADHAHVPDIEEVDDEADTVDWQCAWSIGSQVSRLNSGTFYQTDCLDDTVPNALLFIPNEKSSELETIHDAAVDILEKETSILLPFLLAGYYEGVRSYISPPRGNLGGNMLDLIQSQKTFSLQKHLPVFQQIATAIDEADELGLMGAEVIPRNILVSDPSADSVTAVEDWPAHFRGKLNQDSAYSHGLVLTIFPQLVGANTEGDTQATVSLDDLASDSIARFGSLIYRAVSGMSVRPDAYLRINSYVSTSNLSEESNRFLSEIISGMEQEHSAMRILMIICESEGITWETDIIDALIAKHKKQAQNLIGECSGIVDRLQQRYVEELANKKQAEADAEKKRIEEKNKRAEAERIRKEKEAKEAKLKEQERIRKEEAEKATIAEKEKLEQEKAEKLKEEQEQREKEEQLKKEKEAKAREKEEAKLKAEAEKAAAKEAKAAALVLKTQQKEQEQTTKKEQEHIQKEKAEAQRLMQEAEKAKQAADKAVAAQKAKEEETQRKEAERLKKQKQEQEEQERKEKERLKKEKQESDRIKREATTAKKQAAKATALAEKLRKKAEKEKAQKEAEEKKLAKEEAAKVLQPPIPYPGDGTQSGFAKKKKPIIIAAAAVILAILTFAGVKMFSKDDEVVKPDSGSDPIATDNGNEDKKNPPAPLPPKRTECVVIIPLSDKGDGIPDDAEMALYSGQINYGDLTKESGTLKATIKQASLPKGKVFEVKFKNELYALESKIDIESENFKETEADSGVFRHAGSITLNARASLSFEPQLAAEFIKYKEPIIELLKNHLKLLNSQGNEITGASTSYDQTAKKFKIAMPIGWSFAGNSARLKIDWPLFEPLTIEFGKSGMVANAPWPIKLKKYNLELAALKDKMPAFGKVTFIPKPDDNVSKGLTELVANLIEQEGKTYTQSYQELIADGNDLLVPARQGDLHVSGGAIYEQGVLLTGVVKQGKLATTFTGFPKGIYFAAQPVPYQFNKAGEGFFHKTVPGMMALHLNDQSTAASGNSQSFQFKVMIEDQLKMATFSSTLKLKKWDHRKNQWILTTVTGKSQALNLILIISKTQNGTLSVDYTDIVINGNSKYTVDPVARGKWGLTLEAKEDGLIHQKLKMNFKLRTNSFQTFTRDLEKNFLISKQDFDNLKTSYTLPPNYPDYTVNFFKKLGQSN